MNMKILIGVACLLASVGGSAAFNLNGLRDFVMDSWSNALAMGDGKVVSVILPVRNEEGVLEMAVESMKAQTHTSWELIIVDDASTDGTARLAAKLAATEKRIRVLQNANPIGGFGSMNVGLDVARGEYVIFQRANLWSTPDRLESQVRSMEADGVDMSGGAMIRSALSTDLLVARAGRAEKFMRAVTSSDSSDKELSIFTIMFKRSLFSELGKFAPTLFAGDEELLERFLAFRAHAALAVPTFVTQYLAEDRTYIPGLFKYSSKLLVVGARGANYLTHDVDSATLFAFKRGYKKSLQDYLKQHDGEFDSENPYIARGPALAQEQGHLEAAAPVQPQSPASRRAVTLVGSGECACGSFEKALAAIEGMRVLFANTSPVELP